MERHCFTLRLKPGSEDQYQRRHEEIWPELADAIRGAGISNFTLFRRDLEVIGYCECVPDGATAFARVGETDIDRRWTEFMADLVVDSGGDGEMTVYTEVWHQD